MAKEKSETKIETVKRRVLLDGVEVSIKKARAKMDLLTEEAAELREEDSSGAKARRVAIARELRAIQKAIDATEPIVEVYVPVDATVQFPFRIGPNEFWPGTYKVRAGIAQTLLYMMSQHKRVEARRTVIGGNTDGYEELEGGVYPPRAPRPHDHRGRELETSL